MRTIRNPMLMKNLLLFALATSLFFLSCEKDEHQHDGEGPYLVSIDIQSPAPGAVAAVGQPLPVKVVFNRPDSELIHNVAIQVADMSNQVVATIWAFHVHEPGPYTYESDHYVPQDTGFFKLQAVTTDMAGESPNLKEAIFEVR